MNMFLHEWKSLRISTLIWSLSLSAVMLLFLSMFPAIAGDVEDFKQILGAYPESVRNAIGLSIDAIATLLGYYSFVLGYILLTGAIQAMNLGVSILSKEAREKTAEFLLTKPVTRTQIVTAKVLASLVSLVLTNLVFIAASVIVAHLLKDGSFQLPLFLLLSGTVFLVQLMFFSLGLLISVLATKIKSVLPVSLSTVFAFFVIGLFSSLLGERAIQYLTPFKYFDTVYIMKHAAYEPSFLWLGLVFVIAAVGASYVIYMKKIFMRSKR